jgi:microcystin-dependent protein
MAEPFLAEIRLFAFNFPPRGWAFCNGQFLPINQNQALFSLLGTTYGGNGQTNFALPNLQARVPIHFGSSLGGSYLLGQVGGETAHTLTIPEMAQHAHAVNANSGAPTVGTAAGGYWAANAGAFASSSNSAMSAAAIATAGGGQPHPNESPYLVINMCIALTGIYPSQS